MPNVEALKTYGFIDHFCRMKPSGVADSQSSRLIGVWGTVSVIDWINEYLSSIF
jgi:hypothetical protein